MKKYIWAIAAGVMVAGAISLAACDKEASSSSIDNLIELNQNE